MKSPDYMKLINEEITLHARRISGEKFIFQQNNAAVHTAKIIKNYFDTHDIKVLTWPARSPDLNIIENVWGQLTRYVYRGGKQFNSLDELKIAIEEGWNSISRKLLKKLYKSLPNKGTPRVRKSLLERQYMEVVVLV